MNFGIDENLPFKPIRIALLVISDTRTLETDTSGAILMERIEAAGHNCRPKRYNRRCNSDQNDGSILH